MHPGDVIQERYQLEEVLGEGGMATVWRARDLRLERTVAVKELDSRLAGDPEYMVRFFSEAQALARVKHPNVIDILDFGQHDEHPYLVMDCVDGGSAADLIGEPVLPERAVEIVREAAAACGAAHMHGIVHRDIKPPNILLTPDGRVRLADFGIAKGTGAEPMTATGQAIGSPHYISPEQVSGRSAVPASDVYSLGVVLYELLTGHKPFDGTSITQVAISHVDEQPQMPSEHIPDLDRGLERLVMKCLEKDASDRFEDGRALAEALAATFEGGYADDEDSATPLPLWRRPSLMGAAVLTMVLLLAAGFIALGAYEPTTPPAEAESPAAAEPKERAEPRPSETAAATGPATSPSPSPTPTKRPRSNTRTAADSEDPAGSNDEPTPEPTPTPTPTPSPSPTVTDGGATGAESADAEAVDAEAVND